MAGRRSPGDGRGFGILLRPPRRFRIACNRNAFSVRTILHEPAVALSQALRMGIDAFDSRNVAARRQQVLMDRQQHFAANLQWRGQQQVHGAAYRALGRIFQRHHAITDIAGFHRAKNLIDGIAQYDRRLSTEMLDHCLFAECSTRAEARNRKGILQRTARGNDFGEQVHDHLVGQRSRIVLRQPPQHLGFALRAINRTVVLEFADGMRRR